MKIGIYGAGSFCSQVDRTIPYIAVDGGIAWLNKLAIQPIYIVGDFDSYDQNQIMESAHITILPCHKDYTDTEVALMEAVKMGYDEIELYGVTGGRLDHFFAVCRLLVHYQDLSITIKDDQNKIFLLSRGVHIISKEDYDYLSFFAIERVCLTLKSVAYPLDHFYLDYDNGLCVSNEIVGSFCQVECDQPLYCVQARKEKNG